MVGEKGVGTFSGKVLQVGRLRFEEIEGGLDVVGGGGFGKVGGGLGRE